MSNDNDPCEYDVCECGYTRRVHDHANPHDRLGACDKFVFSEEGRCEVCTKELALLNNPALPKE